MNEFYNVKLEGKFQISSKSKYFWEFFEFLDSLRSLGLTKELFDRKYS
jgi:hypothetical protein